MSKNKYPMQQYRVRGTNKIVQAFQIKNIERHQDKVTISPHPGGCNFAVELFQTWADMNGLELSCYYVELDDGTPTIIGKYLFESTHTLVDYPLPDSENKYHRRIFSAIDGEAVTADVYEVLLAFEVTCPATQHAVKKLLCGGLREKGSRLQDLQEAAEALQRAIEFEERIVGQDLGAG